MPLDQLKIDQSFIRDLSTDPNSAAIVETIISMARNLNLKTIAEGVETEEEVTILKAMGCEAFQGFYFGRPVNGEAFSRYM
jgi:EAL domain-containing protein (putative c-di-GMP-specific phosphodiesterase class I)